MVVVVIVVVGICLLVAVMAVRGMWAHNKLRDRQLQLSEGRVGVVTLRVT